jgi:hypothetical protein
MRIIEMASTNLNTSKNDVAGEEHEKFQECRGRINKWVKKVGKSEAGVLS